MTPFIQKIKALRQEKGWTQSELAKKLSIHQKQVSAYETGRYTPSTDVLVKMAEAFDVSLDYLVFGIKSGQDTKLEIKDRELLRYVKVLDRMSEKDRILAKELIKLFALKNKVEGLLTEEEIERKILVNL